MSQTNKEYRKNSFEPRVGIVQLIFGIIYCFVTMAGIILYFKVIELGDRGYMQLFFVVLFAILAFKSFLIFSRNAISKKNGIKVTATVDNVTPTHGITIVEGQLHMPDGTLLPIESRFAGENFGHELKRYLNENNNKDLPALLVNQNSSHPKGMFLVKSFAGHLVKESTNI
ncbi:MAG: hypothetical protein IJ671_08820 [Succinivibrio sp.]|nr:hypothetical protein [Succinivibrio sp.]MBR1611966.1 hypothetical protein [Succinivibrio sp.]MBR1613614.1 hypothetical protein [Succinivibrio sp.]